MTRVSEILKRGNDSEIEWTKDGLQRWQLYGRRWEAYTALRAGLAVANLVGKRIKMPKDEGETYAFFFTVRGEQMYGKICLTSNESGIVIYSAHTAERNYL